MISEKIRLYIQHHPDVLRAIDQAESGSDWKKYSRSVFEKAARVINHHVTQRVLSNPILVTDLVLIGADEMESLSFRHGLNGTDDLLDYLRTRNAFRPYTWVSGKTLHSYWHGGNPKEKKYNVLLAFAEPDVSRWTDWKSEPQEKISRSDGNSLLKKHFLGCYYRIYRKTDGSENLIRAPFLIRENHEGNVVIETKTSGHEYRSSYVAIREGALYADCENLNWNERESHIFNIGFESNPQIVTGVSTTLDKRKNAMALLNVLVKVPSGFVYDETDAEELPFGLIPESDRVMHGVLKYLTGKPAATITSNVLHSADELIRIIENPSSVR